MRSMVLVGLLTLVTGCSSGYDSYAQAPPTMTQIYQECVNNLYSRPFYLKETNAHNRLGLEVEWKRMCMDAARGTPSDQLEQQNRNMQMQMGLILQNQYLQQLQQIQRGY